MSKSRGEEQFPLLLVLVGDKEVSQNNKRLFGKGRFDGITSGATAIITEWPNYLSSCWITALTCGIGLFTVSILLSSCLNLEQHSRMPRCSHDVQLTANKTIHLVHTSKKWSKLQLDLLQNITANFKTYQIHLIIVNNKNWLNKTNSTNATTITENKLSNIDRSILQNKSNILITHTTYRQAFENTPLFLNWVSLNHQMRIFAIRVLHVWQFGGLSFDIPEHESPRKLKNASSFAELKVQSLIQSGYVRYENLESDAVSVDINGFHMESKTPCHAFFEKVLIKLNRSNGKSTPRAVLARPMWIFCKLDVIDRQFCLFKAILL